VCVFVCVIVCVCVCVLDSLRMLAVFSVVISISGSVKYSDATHRPFSGPEREREGERERERERERIQSYALMEMKPEETKTHERL